MKNLQTVDRTFTKVKELTAIFAISLTLLVPLHLQANTDNVEGTIEGDRAAVMQLTPLDDANFVSVKSGNWSNPDTWENGEVPTENAQVLIADGHTVLFDAVQEKPTEWVRVDGTLKFDENIDTRMLVETMTVGEYGNLIMGTEENPIGLGSRDATARITIADAGEAFDHSVDIDELGRGIISLGHIEMHGADITTYTGLVKQAMAGDTEFILDKEVKNWKIGDRLIITGSAPHAEEMVYISSINQNGENQTLITFDKDLQTPGNQGLSKDHTTPEGYGFTHYVANMERNVIVESQNPDILNRRGHFMSSRTQDVDLNNAAFYELGRTDKGKLLNDVSKDSSGNLVPGTNIRGRWALHVHEAGVSTDATPGHVEGCLVMGCPGWGYTIDSSYVNYFNNVAYGVKGAAFAQEFGNGRGTFTKNLAINSYGGTGNWRTPIIDR